MRPKYPKQIFTDINTASNQDKNTGKKQCGNIVIRLAERIQIDTRKGKSKQTGQYHTNQTKYCLCKASKF
ncbi:MAG: hypothetical protein COA78_24200 [Blastopirellula sp.]|nr:MAG: hypothetical protein COA78_24200 [Blastopirellula sp.]